MTLCTNARLFADTVDDHIKQYETQYSEDTLEGVVSESVEETLDRLYGLKGALDDGNLDYVNAQGYVGIQNYIRSETLSDAFKEVVGDTFKFTYGRSQYQRTGIVTSIEMTHWGAKVTFTNGGEPKSYYFLPSVDSNGRSEEKKKDNGDISTINIPEMQEVFNVYRKNIKDIEEGELVLGSSEAKLKLPEKYRQQDYIHGSIEHMKSTLQRLHILGGAKANDEDLELYMSYLDKMSPDFFKSLELYIKEKGAKQSHGTVSAKRMDIEVKKGAPTLGNQQSEASVYMEEVIHSMTVAAMNSKTAAARRLTRQLEHFIELGRKQLTAADFLPDPDKSINPEAEQRHAEWLYDYIFTGKHADYEFIAKALAVPEVAAALKKVKVVDKGEKKTLAQRINDFFLVIVDVLRGNITLEQKNQNVHEAIVNLAFRFGELNTEANSYIAEQKNFLTPFVDLTNNLNDSLRVKLDSIVRPYLEAAAAKELEDTPDTYYGRVMHIAKVVGLSLVNPVYRKSMGAVASAYGLKPESSIREVIGGLFQSDQAQQVAEFLVMKSGYVDKRRNTQIDLTRNSVLSEFSDPSEVTAEEEKAMTAVLSDTDLASLFGKKSITRTRNGKLRTYTNKVLRNLLTDDVYLENRINEVKQELQSLDSEHYDWHSTQAVGLGIYMATHQGTRSQNVNSVNIAKGLQSSHRKAPNKKVVAAIDELATLVAIKNTDMDSRNTVSALMKKESKGVQHVADVIVGFAKNSDTTVFTGKNKTHKIKGYSREVFDDSIAMEIAPVEDKAKMEEQGFTFKGALTPRAGDKREKQMGLYVTSSAGRAERLRGSVRMNQIGAKGTSVTGLVYLDGTNESTRLMKERATRDLNRIKRAAVTEAKAMEDGSFDFTDTVFGVMPVLNEDGDVVDYRYMMTKKQKQEMLGQDTRITEVMARSYGNILDKAESREHNAEVLKVLRQDMEENWTAGSKGNDGLTDYIELGPNAAKEEYRRAYYMMPKEFQDFVQNREDKTLAVRSDLYHMTFGYTHLSIADIPLLKKLSPQILLQAIRIAEAIWIDIIKIVKAQILLKIPTVLMSNVFSNLIQATLRGYNPIEVVKMYSESYKNIAHYNADVRRIQELENDKLKISAALGRDVVNEGKPTGNRKESLQRDLKRANDEIEAVKRRMKKSPIHELVELGLDQNVEDFTNSSDTEANRVVNFFDKRLENAPELVKDGLDILFLTKRTKFYQVANEFLEVSDLMARDVQNQLEARSEQKQVSGKEALPSWWLDDKPDDYPAKARLTGSERVKFLEAAKQKRHYDLVEDYINYAKPSGRMEEYLNRVGILMFTKYVKRIQRIIIKTGNQGPLRALIGLLTVSYLGGLPSIHEQSFLAKDWYTDSIGPGNIFPIYSPIEHFTTFITPAMLRSSTYDFSL